MSPVYTVPFESTSKSSARRYIAFNAGHSKSTAQAEDYKSTTTRPEQNSKNSHSRGLTSMFKHFGSTFYSTDSMERTTAKDNKFFPLYRKQESKRLSIFRHIASKFKCFGRLKMNSLDSTAAQVRSSECQTINTARYTELKPSWRSEYISPDFKGVIQYLESLEFNTSESECSSIISEFSSCDTIVPEIESKYSSEINQSLFNSTPGDSTSHTEPHGGVTFEIIPTKFEVKSFDYPFDHSVSSHTKECMVKIMWISDCFAKALADPLLMKYADTQKYKPDTRHSEWKSEKSTEYRLLESSSFSNTSESKDIEPNLLIKNKNLQASMIEVQPYEFKKAPSRSIVAGDMLLDFKVDVSAMSSKATPKVKAIPKFNVKSEKYKVLTTAARDQAWKPFKSIQLKQLTEVEIMDSRVSEPVKVPSVTMGVSKMERANRNFKDISFDSTFTSSSAGKKDKVVVSHARTTAVQRRFKDISFDSTFTSSSAGKKDKVVVSHARTTAVQRRFKDISFDSTFTSSSAGKKDKVVVSHARTTAVHRCFKNISFDSTCSSEGIISPRYL